LEIEERSKGGRRRKDLEKTMKASALHAKSPKMVGRVE